MNNNNIKMTSYKYFIKHSSYTQVKLPKANNNSVKANKKTSRILSYKNLHKTETESQRKSKSKTVAKAKLSFEGIMHNNNINNNNNKRYNIINNNGEKHIHNINININNHINIGSKQFQEIITFSDLAKMKNKNITKVTNKKNNNLYNFLKTSSKNINYISRNKNQSL